MKCKRCGIEHRKTYGKNFLCYRCYSKELAKFIAKKRETLKTLFYLAGEDMLEHLLQQDTKLWEMITQKSYEQRRYYMEHRATHKR